MGTTKLLVADEHPLMIVGIKDALQGTNFEVTAETEIGSRVMPLLGRTQVDLVLLDMRMPKTDGLQCLQAIRSRYPNLKVIMTSMTAHPLFIQQAFQLGAHGFIVKTIAVADLAPAMRQVIEGSVYLPITAPEVDRQMLTEREHTILAAMAAGDSNAQIGQKLWVTEQTVKFHLTNIYRKLNVKNRTQATRYAIEQGLVEHPLLAQAV